MGTLTVYFVGICTHFVPQGETRTHRVVLVNASGGDRAAGIEPHYADLLVCNRDTPDSTPYPNLKGEKICVANVASEELVYHESYLRCIPHMVHHTRQRIDPDPHVLSGNDPEVVAAYFDLTAGELRACLVSKGAAAVVATITTVGNPELVFTSFETGKVTTRQLADQAVIQVQNVARGDYDSPQDFLLHFRTVSSAVRDAWPPTRGELACEKTEAPCGPNTIGPGCSNSTYP